MKNNFIFKHEHKGFTLTEILITLGIIGVVATMTLSPLTKKYQDKIMLTQVKELMQK